MRRTTSTSFPTPRAYANPTSSSSSHATPNSARRRDAANADQRNDSGNNGTMPSEGAPLEATMRCMSAFSEGDKIAFSCYDESKNEITIECSHAHGHDTQIVVDGVLAAMRPNLVLVGNKIAGNAELLQLLTRTENQIPDIEEDGGNGRSSDNLSVSGADSHKNGNDLSRNGENSIGNKAQGARSHGASGGNDGDDTSKTSSIPYKILKTKAFDLRECRSLVINKLRVLTLLRQNQLHQAQQLRQQHGWNASHVVPAADTRFPSSNAGGDRDRRFPHSATQQASTPASSYHSLASLVDFDSTVLLRSLGGLMSYLQSTIFRLEDGATVTVNAINHAHSSSFMRVDATTLHSLHIFSTEHHPLIAKGYGNAKEGFSLFTLLDRCKSKIGRQCLREWMLKPLLDARDIAKRQDGVELFLLPQCNASVGALLTLLKLVGPVDKILVRMQKCHTLPMDFLTLSRTLAAAVRICSSLATTFKEHISSKHGDGDGTMQGQEGGGDNVGQDEDFRARAIFFLDSILERCHVPSLQDLHERVVAIIDEEMTAERKDTVVINYGFNEELDSAKEAFDNLDETLSDVGARVLGMHPEIGLLKVVFLPQVGFLISIDKRQHSHDATTNAFPDLPQEFTFVFTQENEAFFKNAEMRQLDDEIGDLDAFIKDTESLIVSELEDDILECESELRSTFNALAELDCILSFTSCAADLNFVRPEVIAGDSTDNGIVFIENGRHPLQELIIDDEFIKNDTMIDGTNRVNVITGPNFSGKSCYTRQVGMLVYLAHIGSFLPCDKAKISITDQILARISSVETCAVPQSSFQLDLTQMATILRRSTPRTLVLIDEFGKGTAPASGIAVLTAALRKLSKAGCRVICTTHFLEIFSLGLLADGESGTRVLRMAVHIPDSGDDDAVPLFKLEKGVAKSSAGLVCAKMAGVTNGVLDRAKEILYAVKESRPVEPISASLNSNSAAQATAKAALRTFLAVDSWAHASDEELTSLHQRIVAM